MQPIVAFQIDPLPTLRKETDSSLALAYAAQEKGLLVFTYTPYDLFYENGSFHAKGCFITLLENGYTYTVTQTCTLDLSSVTFLLIRQDPPVDSMYLANLQMLIALKERCPHIMMLNDPRGIAQNGEKTLPFLLHDYTPPTLLSTDVHALFDFSRRYDAVILKPLLGHGGNGVTKLHQPSLDELSDHVQGYAQTFPGPLVMQPYLKAIETGDTRILLFQGEPVAVFNRVPPKGAFISNLVQGGYAQIATLSPQEEAICHALKPILLERGVYFAGVDLIGEYLMEVNITSPTGLRAADALYGRSHAALFWENLR